MCRMMLSLSLSLCRAFDILRWVPRKQLTEDETLFSQATPQTKNGMNVQTPIISLHQRHKATSSVRKFVAAVIWVHTGVYLVGFLGRFVT